MMHREAWMALAVCGVLAGCDSEPVSARGFEAVAIAELESVFASPDGQAFNGEFRGAILMRWDRKRFREFSGLHSDDGVKLMAVSDRGALLQLALTHRGGRLVDVSQPVLNRLRGPDGNWLKRKDGDAESLSSDGQGGLVAAFEGTPRLLRYRPPFLGKPQEITLPDTISQLPKNRGIEALTRLCDGRFLVFTQGTRAGTPNAWIGGTGGWTGRQYTRTGGYIPTGATTLQDCSVAVLERRKIDGDQHSIRIRHIPIAGLSNETEGIPATKLLGPLTSRDYKFEGITVAGQRPQDVMLYLISDSSAEAGTILAAFSIRLPGKELRMKP